MSNKWSFWFVFYSISILMLSTNLPSPLYSIYKEEYNFSSSTLTLLFATYALVLIPSLAVFGRASDRYGRKKLIGAGILFSIAGTVLFSVSFSVSMLFIARALQGIAVGMLSGAGTAALMELNPYKNKQVAAIAASIATAGGTALGSLVSGVIAQYLPYRDILPYTAHIILAVPSLFVLLKLKETASATETENPKINKKLSHQVKRSFGSAALTAFLAWAVTALFMSIIPSFIASLMNVHNLAFSGGVVFLMTSSSVLIQLILRKLRHIPSMISGLSIVAFGLIFIILAVPISSITLLLLGTILAGAGQGLSFKGSLQLVNAIAPADQKGKVLSLLYICVYLGVGLPIIGVGLLTSYYGLYHAICYFAYFIGIASLFIIYRLVKDWKRLGDPSAKAITV